MTVLCKCTYYIILSYNVLVVVNKNKALYSVVNSRVVSRIRIFKPYKKRLQKSAKHTTYLYYYTYTVVYSCSVSDRLICMPTCAGKKKFYLNGIALALAVNANGASYSA